AWQTSASLARGRRAAVVALRGAAFLLIGFCLLRPVIVVPSARLSNGVVPIVVDASRSMRLTDADGGSRFEAARRLVRERLVPALDPSFTVDVLALDDELLAQPLQRISPNGDSSDLRGAVTAAS